MARRQDFIQSGQAPKCFLDTIFQKSSHAMQACLAANGLRRFAFESHLADGTAHLHHLEDALAATEAGMVAVGAPATTHERRAGETVWSDACRLDLVSRRLIRLLAFWTGNPHQ